LEGVRYTRGRLNLKRKNRQPNSRVVNFGRDDKVFVACETGRERNGTQMKQQWRQEDLFNRSIKKKCL